MMRRIAQLAIGRGATCRWEIEPDNVGAQRFYRSIGVEVRDKKIGRWNRSAMLQLICRLAGISYMKRNRPPARRNLPR